MAVVVTGHIFRRPHQPVVRPAVEIVALVPGHLGHDRHQTDAKNAVMRRAAALLPLRQPVRLDLYVATMGRVNFGQEISDRKGLHAPLTFAPADGEPATELKGTRMS